MRTLLFLLITGLLAAGCAAAKPAQSGAKPVFAYPETQQLPVVDEYFGTSVIDLYRWLEDDHSAATKAWVDAQNAVTFNYLNTLPRRQELRDRLGRLLDYERESAPFAEGGYTYFSRNSGLQNQSVIYRIDEDGEERVFVDPNTLSVDGTTSISSLSFSPSGRLAAYQKSEGGADWRSVEVLDTASLQVIDRIADVKFSGIAWRGEVGFYYSRYDAQDGAELTAKTDQHRLYFHQVGEPQSADEVVFGDDEKFRYVSGYVTEDQQFLVIYASNTTTGNRLYVKDLTDPQGQLLSVINDETSDVSVIFAEDGTLYAQTNREAPNGRVVKFRLPTPTVWQDVIAETEHALNASAAGGYFFAQYMVDALSQVQQFSIDGQRLREIVLPGPGDASGFRGKAKDTVAYYSFQNYKTPSTLFQLDLATGDSSVYRASKADFDTAAYVSKQVFYASKDGTRVPMIITQRADLDQNQTHPTMLYGYGGFDISLTPRFSSTMAAWLEAGGVYAVPNLRGGGEYGKTWHDAGTQMQKQNVFDDFIAAAEYLIDSGITEPAKLAIRGGSNGGLLVGAVMTQRPDLVAVALPAVGVLDMLRYHTFTAGAGWSYDYGTAEQSKAMFEYLLDYSPVHNVQAGTAYPATLVTTGDHDDRVVPAHSFKFAAQLQAKHAGDAPVLIRVEKDAGHGAGTPTSKIIDLYADVLAFTFANMADPADSEEAPNMAKDES
ncbi:MAG: S9 family peptidase [Pseudomonadales bacterium]|nr:S9 family peptidase [Pseudomonadales bacterium]